MQQMMELNEQEQQLYEELFQQCDLKKITKIPKIVAGELFSSSGLPPDVSLQIADLCGASRLGYFGRSQFYIALKYIAAAQQQLALNPELFGALPLPTINRTALTNQLSNHSYDSATYAALLEPQPTPTLPPPPVHMMASGGCLPPPPTKKHVRNMSGTIQQAPIPPSHLQTHPPQLNNSHVILAQSNSMASQSGIITQGTAQIPEQTQSSAMNDQPDSVGWASFPSPTKSGGQEGTVVAPPLPRSQSPTKVTTPGDGPSSAADWNICGVSKRSFNFDSCSLSSADYATSEASESTDDIWCINDEQREYYVNQFLSMQKDLTSTIKGPIAKGFFEKSKLPTNELSIIWKLSDVNRDGALTLQEFCTAMHLVVLRRNDVELPTVLPPSLMPYTPASSEPFASDLGEELHRRSPSPVAPPRVKHQNNWPATKSVDSVNNKAWQNESAAQWADQQHSAGDQWTNQEHQQWQPTGSEVSSVNWRSEASESTSPLQAQWTGSSHSPTSKPVNFDSAPVIGDAEIAHPVPVKVSPTSQNNLIDGTVRPRTDTEPLISYAPSTTPHNQLTRDRSNTTEGGISIGQPLPVRPRPTPKKSQSVSGATVIDPMLYPPPPQSIHGYQSLPGTTAYPPTVPPRNQWSLNSPDHDPRMAGEVPPDDPFTNTKQVSNENFADFSGTFGEPTNEPFGAPPSQSPSLAASIPYTAMQPIKLPSATAKPKVIAHQFSIRDKKEIQLSIKKQRERNSILVRSSSELHSELQEVVEQRISLEIQLEHLKPC